mmetsp:Transcript_34777/g.62582  ORF Transcript_34777/g.62582 Transcript_34777/m.62582 type:complete len:120 (-) Transcript_34777:212-571(-)
MSSSVAPFWPKGILANAAAMGMVSGLSTAFIPSTRDYFPMNYNLSFGVKVFGSLKGIQIVMGVAVAIHLAETLITLRICKKNNFTEEDTRGWVLLTVALGYPAIFELKRAISKKAGKQC